MSSIVVLFSVFFPFLAGLLLIILKPKKSLLRDGLIMASVVIESAVVIFACLNAYGETVTLFSFTNELIVRFEIDGLSRIFAILVSALWPLAILYSFEYMEHDGRQATFFGFYIMTFGTVVGIAFAANLFAMYLFYEILTLVTFPLVMHEMTEEAKLAGRNYLVYSLGGAAFAFIAMIFVLVYCGTLDFSLGGVMETIAGTRHADLLRFVFVIGFCGFSVKAAMFPFSGWLISAHVAPTPVTALLHAVAVVKAGAFATIRLTYYVFGADFLAGTWAQYVVMGLAIFTIAYGSTMAVKETHFKKRLAYSTISNLSYILFGVTMMSPLGLVAALSHLVFHAVMKICSFFCAGIVMHSANKHYIFEFDNIGRRMPVTFTCFTVASVALTGIPPFAGFISKWRLALAVTSGSSWLAIVGIAVLMYSSLLTAVYMIGVSVRAFFPKNGAKCAGFENISEPTYRMLVPIVVFAVCVLAMGLFSRPLIASFEQLAEWSSYVG